MNIEKFEFNTEEEYAEKGTELMLAGYFIRGLRKVDNQLVMYALELSEGELSSELGEKYENE